MSYQTQTPSSANPTRKITLDDTRADLPPGTSTYAQVTQPAFVYDLPQNNASAYESTLVKPVTHSSNNASSPFSNGVLFQGSNGVNPYHLPPTPTPAPAHNPTATPTSNPSYNPASIHSFTPASNLTSSYQHQYNAPKPAPSQPLYTSQPFPHPQGNNIQTHHNEVPKAVNPQPFHEQNKAGHSTHEDELAAINVINRASEANLLRQREQMEQKSGGILPSFPHIDQTKITEPVSIPVGGGNEAFNYYGQEAKGDSGTSSGSVMTFLPQTVVNKVDTTMREMKG